jgi:ABC-2 type transport system ATP-binding protein
VQTIHATDLGRLAQALVERGLVVEHTGTQLLVHGTDRRAVSEVAHSHAIPVLELSETSRSLEDSLLDLTAGSAEFASS